MEEPVERVCTRVLCKDCGESALLRLRGVRGGRVRHEAGEVRGVGSRLHAGEALRRLMQHGADIVVNWGVLRTPCGHDGRGILTAV